MPNRQTAKPAQAVEWLTPDPTGRQPQITWPDPKHGPWILTPHWASIDGRATMVGLDIRSFVDLPDPDGRYPGAGHQRHRRSVGREYAELTQRVLRGIPISAVRAVSAEYGATTAAGWVQALDLENPAAADLAHRFAVQAAAYTTRGAPRKRAPNVPVEVLRRVAAIYAAAVAAGSTTPAKDVEERLRHEGVGVYPGKSGRDQVRKWIQRARRDHLLPPAGQ